MSDYEIVTVDMRERALEEVNAARDSGADPWGLYQGHLLIAREMKALLDKDGDAE